MTRRGRLITLGSGRSRVSPCSRSAPVSGIGSAPHEVRRRRPSTHCLVLSRLPWPIPDVRPVCTASCRQELSCAYVRAVCVVSTVRTCPRSAPELRRASLPPVRAMTVRRTNVRTSASGQDSALNSHGPLAHAPFPRRMHDPTSGPETWHHRGLTPTAMRSSRRTSRTSIRSAPSEKDMAQLPIRVSQKRAPACG